MKIFKSVVTIILIAFILFAGSCATKKKTFKDGPSSLDTVGTISQPIKPPASVSDSEEFVDEYDEIVDIDSQKIPEPETDYPNQQSTPSQVAEIEEEVLEAAEVVTEAEVAEDSAGVSPAANNIGISSPVVDNNGTTAGSGSAVIASSRGSADRAYGSPGGPGGKERRNNNLAGAGSVNVEGVMDYIKIRNRTPGFNEENARKIINSYIDEAVKEDINYDFAIAQMLYWTAFFTVKDRVESNNLAGLQSSKNWNGKFSTMEEGVRAHIQHLRGYSHGTLKNPNVKPIDPRWEHIGNSRGTVKNFEQIYPRWSASSERYRRNIILILNDSYRYSDRYSSLYK